MLIIKWCVKQTMAQRLQRRDSQDSFRCQEDEDTAKFFFFDLKYRTVLCIVVYMYSTATGVPYCTGVLGSETFREVERDHPLHNRDLCSVNLAGVQFKKRVVCYP